jgi:lipopolysaccharide/colanic/teichoic acid biosynthesis glycosyltransferase
MKDLFDQLVASVGAMTRRTRYVFLALVLAFLVIPVLLLVASLGETMFGSSILAR